MGRGSGTQNHCGNVTYRKLVFLNKVCIVTLMVSLFGLILILNSSFNSFIQELYATSTKFDKLKISKAIVATVREFGGFFLQADEKRGGLYFDIGDKRAWDKTSQALREGQAEVRARLAEEDPAGMSKVAEYKDVISGQAFFAFACRMMESLLHPDGEGGSSACGGDCPHAKRRHTLNQLGANPMQIHNAMHSLSPPPLPPVQGGQPYLMGAANGMQNNVQQQYNNAGMMNQITPNANSFEPLTYNAATAPQGGNFDPLPYTAAPNQYDPNALPPTEVSAMLNDAGIQKPGLMYDRGTSGGTVFSLRKFCSEDFEMSSEEGKELMDQLNAEVDQLIRRKSHGLIQIDTTEAFEDLVFEEDSMMFDTDLRGVEPLKNEASENAAQSKGGLGASALTYKDDMSLMNMSILSLDERGESTRGLSTKDGDTPKSILNDSSTAPRDMRKRGTRVSFAGKNRNISLMSMDERSFSKLVDTISDPENVVNEERNMSGLSSDSSKSVSRKM